MTEQSVTFPLGAPAPADHESAAPSPGLVPAAVGSPLYDLRERRTRLIAGLFIDLEVPRWTDDGGPSIWVRYGPIPGGFIAGAVDRRSKQKGTLRDEWTDYVNSDVLVTCCIGVYAKDGEDKISLRPGDSTGDWTKFDQDLAAALGVDAVRAVDVCRELYFTADDRTMAVTQLTDWSAQESTKIEKAAQGN